MTATLMDLTEQLQEIERQLIENGGELTPDLEAALDAVLSQERSKVDGYWALIAHFSGLASTVEASVKTLQAKHTALLNAKQRLNDRVMVAVDLRGAKELKGDVFRAVKTKNGSRSLSVFVEPTALPTGFQRVTVEADKTALKAAADPVTGAVVIDGTIVAQLEPAGHHIRWY